ncbi:hypothetical protein F5B17DRAFT_57521 [Nemania serpens]|nr:hypothetical protein F5B17DRAFT_57521 [Nemania serpens]
MKLYGIALLTILDLINDYADIIRLLFSTRKQYSSLGPEPIQKELRNYLESLVYIQIRLLIPAEFEYETERARRARVSIFERIYGRLEDMRGIPVSRWPRLMPPTHFPLDEDIYERVPEDVRCALNLRPLQVSESLMSTPLVQQDYALPQQDYAWTKPLQSGSELWPDCDCEDSCQLCCEIVAINARMLEMRKEAWHKLSLHEGRRRYIEHLMNKDKHDVTAIIDASKFGRFCSGQYNAASERDGAIIRSSCTAKIVELLRSEMRFYAQYAPAPHVMKRPLRCELERLTSGLVKSDDDDENGAGARNGRERAQEGDGISGADQNRGHWELMRTRESACVPSTDHQDGDGNETMTTTTTMMRLSRMIISCS